MDSIYIVNECVKDGYKPPWVIHSGLLENDVSKKQ